MMRSFFQWRPFLALWLACSFVRAEVSVQFKAGAEFTPDQLRAAIAEQLLEIDSRGLTPARADDAAFFLSGFYRKAGYSKAEVAYSISGGTLVLSVTSGPKTILRSLRFVGNRSKNSTELADYFSGVPIDDLAAQKLAFVEAEASAGADRIRGFYQSEGWLDVVVDIAATRISDDATAADVVVTIQENQRYTLGELSFAGDIKYPREQLIPALGIKPLDPTPGPLAESLQRPDRPFTPALADAMQGSLRSWLRERGHFNARVEAQWSKQASPRGRVPVKFVISAGPVFRVTGLDTPNLDRVKPSFLQHRFSKIVGQQYDPAKIDEKYRELLRTGLFRTMRIVPKDQGNGELRLALEAQEEKQKEFGFEVGFGSYDGLIAGIRLADRNIFRSGRPLSLALESSQRGFEGELLYVDQWFMESDWTLRARLYSKLRTEEGYERSGVGVRADFSRKVSKHVELTAFGEAANYTITSEEIDPLLLGPLDYQLFAIGIAQTLDYRDNPLNPRRGFIINTSAEADFINGGLSFTRFTARYSHYRSFGSSMLAFGLRAGLIMPVGEVADIPIDLRYFNGGSNSVRSYAERDLGPKEKGGHPLGGAFYTVANVEYDFPLTSTLNGAVFIDAGNLVGESEISTSEVAFAIGLGLRYQLPIGPMRLDYGYNPAPKEGEASGAVHFSFGFAF